MMNKIVVFLYLIGVMFVMSCASSSVKNEAAALLGSEVVIPSDMSLVLKGRDTLLNDYDQCNVKLIVYYDSSECSSCEVNKMYEWDKVVAMSKAMNDKFRIYFIFSPKTDIDVSKIKLTSKQQKYAYPIFIDKNFDFERLNPEIVKDRRFHVLMINSENKVIFIGSPLKSPKLNDLFYKTLNNKLGVVRDDA